MILKQSTAATIVVGPVLDSAGAAVTTAVAANFSLSKNGTVNALTSETVTHSTNGYYTIALTSSNTDTLGRVEIIVNDSAMSMATHRYNVASAASYDLIISTGSLSVTERNNIAEAAANVDILTTPFSANTWARVLRDTYLDVATVDVIVDQILADTADMQPKVATAQEIGDAFLSHVITKGDPGTIERAFWQVTKAAASFDGTVQTSVSNTASSFLTDIAIDDFAGQVLVLVDGALAGEARAITSVVSGVVTVHDAFTGVPADGVNFLVLPQQVYSISQIQSGLATSSGVTSAFTEIKGATWDSGTDTLEAIRDASGEGSGVSALLPAIGVVPVRVDQTMLTAFVGETIDVAIVVYQSDGTTPMDLSGKTLEVCFEGTTTTDVAVVANADITVSGDDNNIVTFAYPSAVTGSVANYHWSLRDAAAPKTVWQYGTLYVKRAALKD